jgi:hypothetical protein
VGLTRRESCPSGVKVTLVLLDFDGDCCDIVVELVVVCDNQP